MTAMVEATATGELSAAVDACAAVSLSSLAEDDLLSVLREVERCRRRLEAFEHRLIAELDERNLPSKHSMPSTAAFLATMLNLSPREAGHRVRHARHLGPRITVTGERLQPLLPATAAARTSGSITAQHASVIIGTINKLPTSLPVSDVAQAEEFLIEQAQQFDARVLAGIARQLLDTLDPDGTLDDEARQRRRRFLTLVPTDDGMHRLTADLDGETAALAMTVLHSLAAPQPSEAGDRDERTSGQRLHDALRAVLRLALRSGQLPRSGGVPATVLITMTVEQFATGTGLPHTSFGQRLTVGQALRIAGEASIGWVVHGSTGAVLSHGRSKRIATEGQTLALIARDRGCAFPSCTSPPEWTERHHIRPWSQGGETDLSNLVLLCDHHHDRVDTGGWTITMQDGLPWFIPPSWIDPEQKPRQNNRIQRR
jgi:hypothetical protein